MGKDGNTDEYLVSIYCLAYNHAETIAQCLAGIVNQQTDFKYVAVVHDDASTDGTAEIIRKYEKKYPDIIKPIYEKENKFSSDLVGLKKLMNRMCDGKYIAYCEGDDYWIDPFKLQKQVDFLEKHEDYSMVCSDAHVISNNGELNWSRSNVDCTLEIDKIISSGSYIITPSTLHRRSVMDDYPDFCVNCFVGDYPTQIFCALKGKVFYFASKMVAYRWGVNEGSFTAQSKKNNLEEMIPIWTGELSMLCGLDEYSKHKYSEAFKKTEESFIRWVLREYRNEKKLLVKDFLGEIPSLTSYDVRRFEFYLFCINHNIETIYWIAYKARVRINKIWAKTIGKG